MKNEAAIIGYSGHAYVLLDILLKNNIQTKFYCEKTELHNNPYNLAYLGNEKNFEVLNHLSQLDLFLGIGDNKIRAAIYNYLSVNKISMPFVRHPRAEISDNVTIALATVVMPGVMINAFCKIGSAVICNTSCVIEHECSIGNFVHVAPGAVIAGGVEIGDFSFIGANTVIKQGIKIGKNVIVGAGSVVLYDLPNQSIAYGNPCKIK